MHDKRQLREQAIAHLSRIRPGDEDTEALVDHFTAAVPVTAGQVVAMFWPMKDEIDVRYVIDALLRRDVTVALPVPSRERREMVFSAWDGKGDLVKGAFGVFVPPIFTAVEPDIVAVPMLAFDRKGTRLGRGAGHYDATIAALRARRKMLAVGVAYASQAVIFSLPVEPHDQKLDLIVTPVGVQDFRN